ncbi:hypothetical protein Nepgr_003818 [Nepenthes gracilis]|uniref:Uncharacterized protein n=1 Tax=Nepenthes gracilis TaxID=150966 RepID=A0AAD3XE73_NEPGR|nr:hypothetical protein Nepgr_003818 [Nepenthes gracilis]
MLPFLRNQNRRLTLRDDVLLSSATQKVLGWLAYTQLLAIYQGIQYRNVLSTSLKGDGISVAPSFGPLNLTSRCIEKSCVKPYVLSAPQKVQEMRP